MSDLIDAINAKLASLETELAAVQSERKALTAAVTAAATAVANAKLRWEELCRLVSVATYGARRTAPVIEQLTEEERALLLAAQRDLTGVKGSRANHDWRVECLEEGIATLRRLIDPSVYYAQPTEAIERPEPQWMKEGFFEYDDKEAA
jgi:hypothetical protein